MKNISFLYLYILQLQKRTEYNTRRVDTLVTHALQLYLILCAALIFMHLAAPLLDKVQ